MKRLNLKLVIFLAAGTVALLVCAYFAHAFQTSRGADQYRTQAEAAEKDGNSEDALRLYVTYLRKREGGNKDDADYKGTLAAAAKLAEKIFQSTQDSATFWQASNLLRIAIREDPDNAELRAEYAELMMKEARPKNPLAGEAIPQLEWLTSLERGPSHDPKYDLLLVHAYEMRDRFDNAIEVCEKMIGYDEKKKKPEFVPDKAQSPKEIDAYLNLAALLREKSNPPRPQEADQIIERMVKVNGDSYKAHLQHAIYLMQTKLAKATKSEFEDLTKLINSEIATALKLAPDDPDVLFTAAQVALSDKDYDRAALLLKRGLKKYPDRVDMHLEWERLMTAQGKLEDAQKGLEMALKDLPNEPRLLWALADVQLQRSHPSESREIAKKLTQLNSPLFPKPRLDLLNAMVLTSEKKWLEASQLLEQLRPGLAGLKLDGIEMFYRDAAKKEDIAKANFMAADCYWHLGEYDKQMEACRRVLDQNPGSYPAQLRLAQALQSSFRNEDALAQYKRLRRFVDESDQASQQEKSHSVKKENNSSSKKEMVLSRPEILYPLLALMIDEQFRRPKEKRDWGEVDALMGDIDEDTPLGEATFLLFNAEVKTFEADSAKSKSAQEELKADAEEFMAAAKEEFSDDPAVWHELASIELRRDHPAAALKVLDDVPESLRGNLPLRLLRVDALVQQGKGDVKARLASLDADSDKLSTQDRAALWQRLGTAYSRLEDKKQAGEYWLKAAEISPNDQRIDYQLFDMARTTGNEAMMSKILDLQRRRQGVKSPEARFVEAARMVTQVFQKRRDPELAKTALEALSPEDKQSLETARKLLDEVNQARPNWYEVARTEGDLEWLELNYDTAIIDYQQALKLGPPDSMTIQVLVRLLQVKNRVKETSELLASLSPDMLKLLDLRLFDINTDVLEKNYDKAIEDAKQVVADNPTNPINHLMLATLYDKGGQSANAEASFRRAIAADPRLSEGWLGLVEHLFKYKKLSEARKALQDARMILPADRVDRVLGAGYERIGDLPEAEQYYKAALEATPDDPTVHRMVATFYMRLPDHDNPARKNQIRREVKAVYDDARKNPDKERDNLLWSRANMASLLLESDTNADFLTAKALLQANIKQVPDDPQYQISLALVLAARLDEPSAWHEAMQILESIKTPVSPQEHPQEQFVLAQLREKLGNWNDARRDMLALVSQPNANPDWYIVFIQMLLRHDDAPTAAVWVDRLQAAYDAAKNSDPTAKYLRASVLVKQGRPKEAVDQLKELLPTGPMKAEELSHLQVVARLMDQLGLNVAAEREYREYVAICTSGSGLEKEKYLSDAKLQLASFLSRQGRIDEAIDLCQQAQALKTEPSYYILESLCQALRAVPDKVQPAQLTRVGDMIKKTIADDPDSVPLLLEQAIFLEIAERFDDAEVIYRDLLRRSEVAGVDRAKALNNLAFTLAQRKKDLPEALSFIDEAIHIYGEKSSLLDTRGLVNLAMGNNQQALKDLSEAMLVPEPDPVKLLHLALAQDLAQDPAAAKATLQRAKERKLDPTALPKYEREFYERLIKDLHP